jgi:hypothetical protein
MELAAQNIKCDYFYDFFEMSSRYLLADTSRFAFTCTVVRIRCEDKLRFLDSLMVLLG